jgi:hypothetical protein
MAVEERNDAVQRVDPMEDPTLSWVGPEPRGTASVITPTALGVFGVLEEDPSEENFIAYAPKPWRRVCSDMGEELRCFMYEIVFKHHGLRFPFSPFAIEVFKHLNLAPSQLHPNSMAFMIAFERLCNYHSVEPTVKLFFRVFQIQRQKGEVDPKHYLKNDEDMSDDELADLAKLVKYVRDFHPARWESRDGTPVLDHYAREQFSPRLIATNKLLECKSRAEANIFFGIRFRHRARLLVSKFPFDSCSLTCFLDYSPRFSNCFFLVLQTTCRRMLIVFSRSLPRTKERRRRRKRPRVEWGRCSPILGQVRGDHLLRMLRLALLLGTIRRRGNVKRIRWLT